MARATTIDDYLDGFDEPRRELLRQVRVLAGQSAPSASEAIKWGYPAWVHPSGTILFMMSGHARHAAVTFTPSTREAFDGQLTELETGKGTVKLRYGEPVPDELLRRMMEYRVREHEDDGVLWR